MWLGFPYLYRSKLIYQKRTPYQTLYVYDKGSVRYMRFASDSWQGALDMRKKEKILFPYQRFFLAFRAWKSDVRSFLSLGVGTGTAMRTIRNRYPAARMTGVDLDANVLQTAVDYFDCPVDDRTVLYAMHGRAFLESADDSYDLVFLDAFDAYSIPFSLRTVESFAAIRQVLEENGLLVVNVIGTVKGPRSNEFRALYKTVRQVFDHVRVLPVSRLHATDQNILLFASGQPIDELPSSIRERETRNLLNRFYPLPIPTDDVAVYLDDRDSRMV
jgi:spermidine synthase